jgi:hypothetical protein
MFAILTEADHDDSTVQGMNCFGPLQIWGSGFESHSGNACLVCVYFVFVLRCVQAMALRGADPPSKETYRLS